MPIAPRHLCIAAMLFAPSAGSAQEEWRKTLETNLQAVIRLTKLSMPERMSITNEGTVVILQRTGIGASPLFEEPVVNIYRRGEVRRDGSQTTAKSSLIRDLRIGENVYVFGLNVFESAIDVFLVTKPEKVVVDGTTRHTRYKCLLRFDFGDGLRSMPFDEVKKVITSIIAARDLEPRAHREVNRSEQESLSRGDAVRLLNAQLQEGIADQINAIDHPNRPKWLVSGICRAALVQRPIRIIAVAETGNEAKVTLSIPLRASGQPFGKVEPATEVPGSAYFQRYDIGWRIEHVTCGR